MSLFVKQRASLVVVHSVVVLSRRSVAVEMRRLTVVVVGHACWSVVAAATVLGVYGVLGNRVYAGVVLS